MAGGKMFAGRRKRPRKKTRRAFRATLVRSVVPRTQIVKMRYVEQITVTTTVALIDHYMYHCNGIYDPNQSGGGHQPLGHDQYSLLYNHYCVLKSNIRVTAINETGVNGAALIGVAVTPTATGAGSWAEYAEQPGTRTTSLGTSDSGRSIASVGHSFNAKRQFRSSAPTSDSRLIATFGGNPTENSFYDIAITHANYGAYGASYEFYVEIDYYVAMIEPKILGIS